MSKAQDQNPNRFNFAELDNYRKMKRHLCCFAVLLLLLFFGGGDGECTCALQLRSSTNPKAVLFIFSS